MALPKSETKPAYTLTVIEPPSKSIVLRDGSDVTVIGTLMKG
jgi:hypothetical protein